MRRIALKGTVFDREIAEITYGSTIVLCTVLGKYCRDYFYMRLIFRSYENAAAPRRFVSAVRAPRYAQLTIVIDFIDKAVQNSRRIGNRFVLNIHLIIDNRLCSRDTGTAHDKHARHSQRAEHVQHMAFLQHGAVPIDQVAYGTLRHSHMKPPIKNFSPATYCAANTKSPETGQSGIKA